MAAALVLPSLFVGLFDFETAQLLESRGCTAAGHTPVSIPNPTAGVRGKRGEIVVVFLAKTSRRLSYKFLVSRKIISTRV